MARRKQATGLTHRKGLGNRHRLARERLLRQHVDGSPCGICGEPMFRSQGLDADHSRPRAVYGAHATSADRLCHRSCNRSEGARLGNALRSNGYSEPDRTGLSMPWP
jgi:5-methylcytosine-specific restriction endonuclease McrA